MPARAAATLPPDEAPTSQQARLDPRLPVPILDATEVHAGDRVTFHWRSLGDAAEELELVFSIDDGRHYDVRVSPELSGGEYRFEWRVPNVGVHQARVRLRARILGRETSGPVGAPFRIVPNPLRAPERWAYRHGEWWEDAGGEPFELPGLIMPPRLPSLRSDADARDDAVVVRTFASSPLTPGGTLAPSSGAAVHDPASPSDPSPRTFRPMRE